MVALVAAVLFHLMNSQVFNIASFPWLMIAGTLLFCPADWPRRVFHAFWRPLPGEENDEPLAPIEAGPARYWVPVFLGVYLTVQVLVPLRHHLYPGDVNWTEEGHRFSWRMMLRSKLTSARFFVRDAETGQLVSHDPRNELSQYHSYVMTSRPDMILQYCHHLRDKVRRRGFEVEIRAHVIATLNGRPPQYMIDPTVNLAAQDRTLKHVDWVMPVIHQLPEADAIRLERPRIGHIVFMVRPSDGDDDLEALLASLKPEQAARFYTLHLNGSAVTDDGLSVLRDYSMLRAVNLSDTRIGDQAIAHLVGLEDLQVVNLERTKVTAEAVEVLRRALPRAVVRH
jgi:hypothetical protein